ncbi:MAG: lysophospholipid acyltransferase family protein [Desulfarculales bacterium]|jgi:KDO2-lipid IV(A) lauroyltransferase|nr:lysophospholipid acyltransferase family protein [Desulfarculales bacterium]
MILKTIQILTRLWALLPLSWSRTLARILGGIWWIADRQRREITVSNLGGAFPEKDEKWVKATARACFEHIAMVGCEMPYLLHTPMKKLLSMTRFHGLENILEAQKEGKGLIALTGHIGNWEWCNVLLGAAGYHGTVIARPLDNRSLDKLVNQWRGRSGQIIVSKEATARILLRALRAGQGVAILLDQNTDWYEGIWVNFFGRPACTSHGLVQLAMISGSPVIPIYCLRAEDGMFDVYCQQPLPIIRSGRRSNDIWENTQRCNDALEKIIRLEPCQWLWQHRRWKDNYCAWPREDA